MVNCSKCGCKIRVLEKRHFKEGNVYCSKCYSAWKEREIKREEMKVSEEIKKALSKNCKWEYKVIQIPTARSGLVATDAKINPQEQLNELGTQGWELVSAIGIQAISGGLGISSPGTTTSVLFIFKRKN